MKPPKTVNIHAAKTHLSALIADAQAGQEIIIAKAGKPVAKLTRIEEPVKSREFGWAKGREYWIAPDFDTYIPEEWKDYI